MAGFLWVIVHHEGPLTLEALEQRFSVERGLLERVLETLVADRQVTRDDSTPAQYRSNHCVIPLGARQGWEAALLDHFQAMVRSMCIKLRNGATRALPDDEVGGSTYTFDVWPGHPRQEEVKALLRETRSRLSTLWDSVTEHNSKEAPAPGALERITFYCGQASTSESASRDE